jgi:hypothetical protein
MKKRSGNMLLAGVLSAVLAFGPLVGCGAQSGTTTSGSEASTEVVEETTEETTEQAADDPTAADASFELAEAPVTGTTYQEKWEPREGYTLKQVVAVSRHNLRAPQEKDMESLSQSTPHSWIPWSSNGSELTVKGGVAETIMGEFFRKWLEVEGLIPQNYIPDTGEVRFYSNPRQRTLATTQYFSSGMLPVANVAIEYHGDYDTRDPVFMPRFGYVSDSEYSGAHEAAPMALQAGVTGIVPIARIFNLESLWDLHLSADIYRRADMDAPEWRFGTEIAYQEFLLFRAGYALRPNTEDGFSAGIGFSFGGIIFDYGYSPRPALGDGNHYLGLGVRF